MEVDISLLPEKAKAKTDKEAEKAKKVKDKAKKVPETAPKKGGRSGKTRAQSSALHLTETSIASPSQSNRKRDSSVALLSASRLQQLASPSLMDSAGGTFHVQGFFFFGSLLSSDAYYVEQKAFPEEWMDMKAFLEMVCLFSSLFNASCWYCISFAMYFNLSVACIVQYKSDKARAFKGVSRTGVDLMVLDLSLIHI